MELYDLTIKEAAGMLRRKEISAVDLAKSCLQRINDTEKSIDALNTICIDTALKQAEATDKLLSQGQASPLSGIPGIIKDNICTMDVRSTCASRLLEEFNPPYDATVIEKLKANNFVLMGKSNMDEFGMGSSTENSAFKNTKNPHDLKCIPGGSSGGSAAAVSSGQALFALGSDTGGSIRQPASYCGVVGLKPTYGVVSRYGLVAFASSLDQIGPLAKTVEDAAIILNAICGHDKKDSTSVDMPYPDYTQGIADGVKGMKIGVPKEYFGPGLSTEVASAVLNAMRTFEKMGALVEETTLPTFDYALSAYYIISSAEAASNLSRYDGVKYGYRSKGHADIVDMYCKTRSEGFGAEVKRRIMLGNYVLSSGYYDAYYLKALKVRTLIKQDFDKLFEKYDVILSPTVPSPAFKIGEKSDPMQMYLTDIYTVPVNIAGLPGLSIPCAVSGEGLPIGLQMLAKPFGESMILKAAFAFEQSAGLRIKPSFKGGENE
jgi:aspartyl-tRNA(Asn)/glutamyl-tRNA(Gln) amidotransferase subunit A